MAGDVLSTLLQMVRAELPDAVPDAVWDRVEANLRGDFGGETHYIARRAKSTHLARLEAAAATDEAVANEQLSRSLGISVRRLQQLRKLSRG